MAILCPISFPLASFLFRYVPRFCPLNHKAPAADARARQTTGALIFLESILFGNRKAPAVIIRCLVYEASQVQTNTRAKVNCANPNRATSLYSNSSGRPKGGFRTSWLVHASARQLEHSRIFEKSDWENIRIVGSVSQSNVCDELSKLI